MIFLTTVIIWLLETGKVLVCHACLSTSKCQFFALMLMNGIVNLATTLPSAPGYVGTFDAPGLPFWWPTASRAKVAAGYTLVLHAALWLPITLLGAYYYFRQPLRWGQLITTIRHRKDHWNHGRKNSMKIAIIGAGVGGMAPPTICAVPVTRSPFLKSADTSAVWRLDSKNRSGIGRSNVFTTTGSSDDQMLGLIDELGLSDQVIFPAPKTVAYHNGKFYPLDISPGRADIPGIYFLDMVRFGLVTVYLRYLAGWRRWKNSAPRTGCASGTGKSHTTLFEPLLVGKFGPLLQGCQHGLDVGAAESPHHPPGHLPGGFQAFCDQFAERLQREGVENSPFDRCQRIDALPGGGWRLTLHRRQPGFRRAVFPPLPRACWQAGPDSAAGLPRRIALIKEHGCCSNGPGAEAPAFRRRLLLVQSAQVCRLSIPGAGRAYQFPLAGIFWRRPYHLLR